MTKSSDQDASKGEATRKRLMQAAVAMVAERGWAGVTTRGVAERAGVNHGLVHYHFGSVDALLVAAATSAMTAAAEAGMVPIESDDFVQGLVTGVLAMGDSLPDDPVAVAAMEFMVQACRHAEMRAWLEGFLRSFRSTISERVRVAVESGDVIPSDPDAAAALIVALIDGLLLHRLADPSLDLAAAMETFAAWITGRKDAQ